MQRANDTAVIHKLFNYYAWSNFIIMHIYTLPFSHMVTFEHDHCASYVVRPTL